MGIILFRFFCRILQATALLIGFSASCQMSVILTRCSRQLLCNHRRFFRGDLIFDPVFEIETDTAADNEHGTDKCTSG